MDGKLLQLDFWGPKEEITVIDTKEVRKGFLLLGIRVRCCALEETECVA